MAAPHAGPDEIRIAVRASGVSPGEMYLRSGTLRDVVPITFPYRTGFDAAGVVDEIGDGVTGVGVGEEVFGRTSSATRGANADFAVLAAWAPKPAAWSWEEAGGAAGGVETATRVLDRLAVGAGHTVLVQGAAGGTGTIAVQMAVARGATVIGTASEHNHDFLRSLGAEPTTYVPAHRGRGRARTERKPPRPRKDRAGALTGRLRPVRYPARAGGLWLRRTLDLSRFQAMVVPSG